jgi:hypothetical protein
MRRSTRSKKSSPSDRATPVLMTTEQPVAVCHHEQRAAHLRLEVPHRLAHRLPRHVQLA